MNKEQEVNKLKLLIKNFVYQDRNTDRGLKSKNFYKLCVNFFKTEEYKKDVPDKELQLPQLRDVRIRFSRKFDGSMRDSDNFYDYFYSKFSREIKDLRKQVRAKK